MFCVLRTIFFSWTFSTGHCLVLSTLSQTHHVTLEKPPFSSTSQLQSSRKGMGFLTITKYFIFLTLDLLICEFLLSIVFLGVSDMGCVIFVESKWMGFVDYSFKMLHFSVIMIEFLYWVCLLICCCEILKYSQVYEQYRSIVGQERGQIHRDLNECRKIN